MNDLTVVIPYFNGKETIQRLLDSLPKTMVIMLVDDQSDNPLEVYEASHPGLSILRPEEKGYFTGAVNRGIEACSTDVLILNQDVWFTGDSWLDLLDEALDDYDLVGEGIKGKHPAWPEGYIHGTFMYISREVINKIGLLNKVDYPLWGSTCEYQLRACRAGFRALPLPTIHGFHHREDKKQRFGDAINTALEREPSRRREFIRTPPEISVIIPNHNYGRYLEEAVNSLMGQTFQSFEVVIVDDASTDNSQDIIRTLVDPWKGIRAVCLNNNAGTAGALNAGIEASHGHYIAILSADDAMKPNRLENFYRLQLENPHSFIYDDLVVFGDEARKLGGTHLIEGELIFECPDYNFDELLKKNGVHAGIFYPKQAWEEAGGYPVTMGRGREDWAFNVALGLKGWCGVKCPTPGYLYRREGQNRTLTNTDPASRQRFMGQMLALYPDVYRGVKPMGCCGGSSSPKLNGGSGGSLMATRAALPGRDGFEILEYIGTSSSDMTWWGPETGQRYIFGGNRKVGYVDRRDVAKMVALKDRGKQVFQVYQKPAGGPKAETPDEISGDEQETALPFDPAGYTVSGLNTKLDDLDRDELLTLLEAEKAGLNRKGAIAVIEGALDNA